MTSIDRKTLEKLAELAKIKLDEAEEEKLVGDLEEILNHFQELKEVDTSSVEPMTGGTTQRNVFKDDGPRQEGELSDEIIDAFPKKEECFLEVPAVFE